MSSWISSDGVSRVNLSSSATSSSSIFSSAATFLAWMRASLEALAAERVLGRGPDRKESVEAADREAAEEEDAEAEDRGEEAEEETEDGEAEEGETEGETEGKTEEGETEDVDPAERIVDAELPFLRDEAIPRSCGPGTGVRLAADGELAVVDANDLEVGFLAIQSGGEA